mgnify:CR=1 FL=1
MAGRRFTYAAARSRARTAVGRVLADSHRYPFARVGVPRPSEAEAAGQAARTYEEEYHRPRSPAAHEQAMHAHLVAAETYRLVGDAGARAYHEERARHHARAADVDVGPGRR